MHWPPLTDETSTKWSLPTCESVLPQHLTHLRGGAAGRVSTTRAHFIGNRDKVLANVSLGFNEASVRTVVHLYLWLLHCTVRTVLGSQWVCAVVQLKCVHIYIYTQPYVYTDTCAYVDTCTHTQTSSHATHRHLCVHRRLLCWDT